MCAISGSTKRRDSAEQMGREAELHIVQGEQYLAEGREADAAREFEAGGLWWRAGEMYQRAHEYAKAAEMYARHGDEERAAEMYVAAGQPRPAAVSLERLGKRPEAAQYYQQAGEHREAARVLQEIGDFFGAAREFLAVGAGEDAMALLQQVAPESERYLEATILLGDLFVERNLDGPAREKYERAVALRPSGPEFVYPTYQLARMQERQGNLQDALRLYEKVVAEQFDYRDVQQRVSDLWDRLAATTQIVGVREVTARRTAPSRYRILREVGRGGMGIVYQAEDAVLQRPVAYKVLPDAVRDDPRALEDFLREARIAASLHHPNIVTIYDAGQAADAVYIAMEYVEGRSLQDILDEMRIAAPPRALDIFRQACRSLIHAHRQRIVHRDVKPANIMVTRDGGRQADGLRVGGGGLPRQRQGDLGARHPVLHGAGADHRGDDLGPRRSVRAGVHALSHGGRPAALRRRATCCITTSTPSPPRRGSGIPRFPCGWTPSSCAPWSRFPPSGSRRSRSSCAKSSSAWPDPA